MNVKTAIELLNEYSKDGTPVLACDICDDIFLRMAKKFQTESRDAVTVRRRRILRRIATQIFALLRGEKQTFDIGSRDEIEVLRTLLAELDVEATRLAKNLEFVNMRIASGGAYVKELRRMRKQMQGASMAIATGALSMCDRLEAFEKEAKK